MQLLTVQQLAEYLQMSNDKVYDMVRKGEIPAIKIRQHWRFDREAIEAWLKSCIANEGTDRSEIRN